MTQTQTHLSSLARIEKQDPELADLLAKELDRQRNTLEMIASENFCSLATMDAQGTWLTNKYAEGLPAKRYYGGCEHVDDVETLAIERAKQVFGANYVNVQPHSGAQANAAVFLAFLSPGDTILGLNLSHGGHLTHGAAVSFSGRIYNSVQYGLNPDTGEIDYAEVERLAQEHKPKMIVAGFSAYSRVVDWQKFRDIADSIGAYLFVDMAHVAGLIAAGVYPTPVGIADVVTTTTHKTLGGPRGGLILANDDEELNKKLNFAVFPESQGGPLMHVIAAKAVCFKEAMGEEFKTYQQQVVKNAQAMVSVIQERGIKVVSGGTDDHLFLVDLIGKEYTGKDADAALGEANITVNKNAVPNDPRSPFVTSGLRIGTPAITRRGFGEDDAKALASWICDVLDGLESGDASSQIAEAKAKVLEICGRLPVYR